jgi:RNA polymerase sigma factor (sigma-70 family)
MAVWAYLPVILDASFAARAEWLATRGARRFSNRGEPFDDLLQEARIGLLKAINRFDPQHNVPFGAYATPTIMGELRRHFRVPSSRTTDGFVRGAGSVTRDPDGRSAPRVRRRPPVGPGYEASDIIETVRADDLETRDQLGLSEIADRHADTPMAGVTMCA